MQKLLLLLIFLISLFSYSQNKRIEISGTISDKLGKVVDAHVINISSKQGTFTNENGNFTIPAKLGDQIKITSIQHEDVEVIVAGITMKNKKLDLKLDLKEYILDEVEVQKTYLSGSLSTDSKHIKKSDKQMLMENLGFNPFPKKLSQIDREIYTASTSGGLIPLDLIINTLSGRLKSLKKKRELLENEKRMIAVENKYKPMIINQLKIDSIEVSSFLYFCHFDNDFKDVYYKSEFEMIEFLQKQAKLFKKTKEK